MSETQLDLSQLAIERPSRQKSASNSHKKANRKWITRYVVPGGILLGFGALLLAAAGQSLLPKTSVEVVPVIVKRRLIRQSGTPLFQAAGWIEPRPTTTNVPALAPGVVEELLVVEGQSLKKGEPIARLISIDAEIAVKQAQASLATVEGELQRARAEEQAAKIRLEKPVHLQVQLADAKGLLAEVETELANLPFQIESARADLTYTQKSVQGKKAAGIAVPGVVLQKAESELITADAKLRELRQRQPGLKRQRDALQQKASATQLQLELLIEETRQLQEAKAKVISASAMRDAAQLGLQKAELELERNTIRAPMDGRVLRLVTAPGMRVMGLTGQAGQNSSSVVEMYDPNRLQVRADVRLEDIPFVQHGQRIEIETASFAKTLSGRVLQTNSAANIQKNTLEVKVELINPPAAVRPEMLVTATFLAPEPAALDLAKPQDTIRIFVAKQLVHNDKSGRFVWIVDADNRSRMVMVSVGNETDDNLLEIASGVQATDKIIASNFEALRDGAYVNVSGENLTIGRQ